MRSTSIRITLRLVRIAAALDVPVGRLLAGIEGAKGRGASPLAALAERQPLRLVQAFTAIGDEHVRRSLTQLVAHIARAVPRRRG